MSADAGWNVPALHSLGDQFREREGPRIVIAVGDLLAAVRTGEPERIRLAQGDLDRVVWALLDQLEC
jgi:hypothetical protein